MGAKCCMLVRDDKPFIHKRKYGTRADLSTSRNIRYSPSWSFRWDNRTHIEDNVDNPAWFSHHLSGTVGPDFKSGVDTETEVLSDGGSPADVFLTPKLEKLPHKSSTPGNSGASAADQFIWSNSSPEEKYAGESLSIASASDSKRSSSTARVDPSSSRSCSLPASNPIPSRKACRSPGYPLLRQVSDSMIPNLEALNELSPEVRQFMLSAYSNDVSTGGSQVGGSFSEGWSTRSFSEVAASSQESWSFDSQNLSKIARTNAQSSLISISTDSQTCGVCSNLLKERASWSNEIAVVAILACGHFYHSQCLESVTPEAHKFDPPCPTCTNGESSALKMQVKSGQKARSKISRTAVADIDVDGDSLPDHLKSSRPSVKSSFARPFLRRHFSFGSRHTRSVPECESSRKKGLWARYR